MNVFHLMNVFHFFSLILSATVPDSETAPRFTICPVNKYVAASEFSSTNSCVIKLLSCDSSNCNISDDTCSVSSAQSGAFSQGADSKILYQSECIQP